MKTILCSTFFILLLVFVVPGILSLSINSKPNDFQPSLNGTQKIYNDVIISQEFVSLQDNLSELGMSIKNPFLINKKDIKLEIYSENNKLLGTRILNGKNIGDGDFVRFYFTPIKDSKQRKFIFKVSAPDSEKIEALEIFLTVNKPLWIGNLFVGDTLSESTVSFVSFHKPSGILDMPLIIYSSWITKLLNDRIFFYFYVLLITILVSYLVKSFFFNSPSISR